MSTDCLKPRVPAKRAVPQLQWDIAEARTGLDWYERLSEDSEVNQKILSALLRRFNSDKWDEESRVFLAEKGLRTPASESEVAAIEEAMQHPERSGCYVCGKHVEPYQIYHDTETNIAGHKHCVVGARRSIKTLA